MTKIGLATPQLDAGAQPRRGAGRARARRPAGDHPALVHARRHRRRHRLQPRGVRSRSSSAASTPRRRTRCWSRRACSAGRSSRWRWSATRRTTASSSAPSRTSIPMGVHTGDSHHRRAGADADRQGIPDHAQRLDRGAARDRGGDRRLQRAVRRQPGRRPPRRHRDEPARVALLRAGLQGDRLPDRQGRRQARRRLHAGRARERHHGRRHAGLLRADHRLRRHQDPALCLREVPRRRAHADHLDEIGRRGDGDRAHVRRKPAEGAALAWRPGLTGLDDVALEGLGAGRRQERDPRRARPADARPAAQGGAGHAARRRPRADPRLLQDRPLVPRAHPGDRRQEARVKAHGLPADGRAAARAEGDGLLGCAARQARQA